MTISTAYKTEAFHPAGSMYLILLTVNHANFTTPIRIVNDFDDVVSNGDTFVAFPFEIQLPSRLEDSPPIARITIVNVSTEIGIAIRQADTPPTVTIDMVRRDTPNTIEVSLPSMILRNTYVDAAAVTGELTFEDLTREPYPAYNFTAAYFPGMFA